MLCRQNFCPEQPAWEKMGLIPCWMRRLIVCGDIRDTKHREISFCPVSVNLSRMYAGRREIMGVFRDITEEYGIGKGELSFEITETAPGPEEGDDDGMPRLVRYL